MKKLAIFLVLATSYLLLSTSAFAQYGQYGQYGGTTPNLSIVIDKMVGKPANKGTDIEFVDNLSPSDPRFTPNQDVFFRLKVKNTSNVTLTNVQVKDFVPSYIEPVEGPGTYDSNTRTITFGAGDFKPDEEKTYTLKMRVNVQENLPSDKGLFCIVNKSQASNDKALDEDTAQLCIEKQVQGFVQGVTKVPSAGPELGLAFMAGQLLTLGAGIFLKRKTS